LRACTYARRPFEESERSRAIRPLDAGQRRKDANESTDSPRPRIVGLDVPGGVCMFEHDAHHGPHSGDHAGPRFDPSSFNGAGSDPRSHNGSGREYRTERKCCRGFTRTERKRRRRITGSERKRGRGLTGSERKRRPRGESRNWWCT
jgi:hypothetical protein